MNGFVNVVKGFSQVAIDALVTQADEMYIDDVVIPPDGVEITGLQNGNTVEVATHNSDILNTALEAGGALNLYIPSSEGNVDGVWYTYETVYIQENTTLEFVGSCRQFAGPLNATEYHAFRVQANAGNIIINNPLISQEGIEGYPNGSHSCLAIYSGVNDSRGITVNDGILEYGASNAFHGGGNNITVNRTLMTTCTEHIVYAAGARRDDPTDPDVRPVGITFNDCIFEYPGANPVSTGSTLECNHVQIRSYKDVTFNRCISRGETTNGKNQFGFNCTGIDGLYINDYEAYDYNYCLINMTSAYNYDTNNVVIDGMIAVPASGTKRVFNSKADISLSITGLDVTSPLSINNGGAVPFNNCIFRNTNYFFEVNNTTATFTDCTFDASASTYSYFMALTNGAVTNFAGTTTRVEPDGGQNFNWSPIPES